MTDINARHKEFADKQEYIFAEALAGLKQAFVFTMESKKARLAAEFLREHFVYKKKFSFYDETSVNELRKDAEYLIPRKYFQSEKISLLQELFFLVGLVCVADRLSTQLCKDKLELISSELFEFVGWEYSHFDLAGCAIAYRHDYKVTVCPYAQRRPRKKTKRAPSRLTPSEAGRKQTA